MKLSCSPIFASFLAIALLAVAPGALRVQAQDSKPVAFQKLFATPDEAIRALQAAVENDDQGAMRRIFGPAFKDLLTGDRVEDAHNTKKLADAMAQGVKPVSEGDDKITLEIGTNEWPMPIPLMRAAGQWYFDTAAGQEEIMNRHIGKDELHAIGVCRAFVTAEKQFAAMNNGTYARKFKSSSGLKDGLYWPAVDSTNASPFGPLVAEAHAEGYGGEKGAGPHAFHGYYFRILTRQGSAAPGGKMDYLKAGKLTGGFALVAYPEHWDKSGIMTFIVSQDGKVYSRDLGEKTARVAGSMKEFNPDSKWKLETDEGVPTAVMEK